MTLLVFSQPALAIFFGAFILCAETCLHFESIVGPESFLDLPWHDWVAGAMLLHAGIVRRRDPARGQVYLAAAWGFMTSLLGGAVVAHAEELSVRPSPEEWIPVQVFFGILIALLLVSGAALVATIRQRLLPS